MKYEVALYLSKMKESVSCYTWNDLLDGEVADQVRGGDGI